MKHNIFCIAILMSAVFHTQFANAQSRFNISVIKKSITRVQISKNMALDIVGVYPDSYYPMWGNIIPEDGRRSSTMEIVGLENFNKKNTAMKDDKALLMLTQKNGKAVFILDGYYAEIETGNSLILLDKKPQSFKLVNFREFKSNTFTDRLLEESKSKFINGGAKGNIEFSANENGDVYVSLVVEVYKQATKYSQGGLSFRYTVNNFLFKNYKPVNEAIAYIETARKNKTADSLKAIETEKWIAEENRLFELKIKNSYADVVKLQSNYKTDYSCIKFVTLQKQKSDGYYVEGGDFVSGPDGTRYYEPKSVYVPTTVLVDYQAAKNTCTKMVFIKGIIKLKSKSGTIYFEDRSIKLEPGEATDREIEIEAGYNPATAEIGIRHYYKNKLPVK